jgi:NitT/TauT family transport system substrate-binding protein
MFSIIFGREMIKILLCSISLVLLLSSCSEVKEKEPLVISVDPWVGSAPFYYAHAKGWLAQINIQLILASSIGENMRIFDSGASDMFTSTQHEYFTKRKTHQDLIPVIHYDRSYGGDMVMANRTNEQLVNSNEPINMYYEFGSVNEEMANYWVKDHNISKDRLRIHSRAQDEIKTMKSSNADAPTVVVTYNPHNLILEKNGFHEIASTKNDNYLVIDAVYAPFHLYQNNQETFHQLSDVIKRAMRAYEANPREFYEKVKPYYGNPTYEDFMLMKKNVQWFETKPPPQLIQRLKSIDFPVKDLI